jgi:predicted Ser/Thr protein kinase
MFLSHNRTRFTFQILVLAVVFFYEETVYFKALIAAQPQAFNYTTATLSIARAGLAAASSGDLVFFGGGFNAAGASDRVDICNATSGSWTTATLSVARFALAAASSENLVFFAGGWDGSANYYNQVDIYNTANGIWSNATLSQSRCALTATSVENLILFAGGNTSAGPSNAVDIYNVVSNTWTTATLSQARCYLASASVASRYSLFAGGWDGSNVSDVVDIYNVVSNAWTTATLSQARWSLAAAALSDAVFIGGGLSNSYGPGVNTVDIFNSTTQTWSTATLSYARGDLAAASVADIAAFGGGTPDRYTPLPIVDIYNATSNQWFTANFIQSCAYLSSTSATNKIFFGGGWQSSLTFCPTVDVFEIELQSALSPGLQPSTPSQTNVGSAIGVDVIIDIVIGIALLLLVVGIILFLILFMKRKKRMKPKISSSYTIEQSLVGTNERSSQVVIDELSRDKEQQKPIENSQQQKKLSLDSSAIEYSQISYNEILIEKEINRGSYGKIYLGKWYETPVALKFCKNKGKIDEFMSEIKLMVNLPSHPNVIHVYGASINGPQPIIVMEYCSGGSLDKLLFNSKVQLSDEHKIRFVQKIAAGMRHLHRYNVIHCDLATRNILLTSNAEPKISDFGLSRILENTNEATADIEAGPICWMAPETLQKQVYTKKSDIWSFGIMVYEIVAQRVPHEKVNPLKIATMIRDKYVTPKIPKNCPEILRELMHMCWNREPEQRPDFEAICTMLS